jgi:hypothetical protein
MISRKNKYISNQVGHKSFRHILSLRHRDFLLRLPAPQKIDLLYCQLVYLQPSLFSTKWGIEALGMAKANITS